MPTEAEFTKEVPRPSPESVNTGLSSCRNSTLLAKFGAPRARVTSEIKPVTNLALKARLKRGKWFGQAITGLDAAVFSLGRIEAKIKANHPSLVPHMGHAGMLACRLVRGSKTSISNHAWGTAIDLTFDGQVDDRGDGNCQSWLLLVYPYFYEEGWFWGTEFPTEDSMHFEMSDESVMSS